MGDSLANTETKDSDPDCTIPETKVEDVDLSTSDNPSADGHSEDVDIPTTVSECMVTNVENQADCDADLAAASEFDADADNDENEGDDDIVNVIIKPSGKGGIYKTGATYQARSVSHTVQHTKPSRQGIELDDPGDIHGVPTIEFNLSSLGEEDKPWKRPGADITDYFNYGFTEETWIQYCEKQKILRQEYANATIKPVLTAGGAGLLQRMRLGTANTGIRSYDNFKQTNINVIGLSNASNAARTITVGMVNQKPASDTAALLLNGVANNSANLLSTFTQPPPGYAPGTTQADSSGSFAMPPPGFAALGASGASQLLTNAGTTGSAGLFPNIALPPPMLNALSNWPGSVSVHNLLAAGDAVIDPTTGQISTLLEHSGRSPESVYSNDDHSSRRKSRHYHGDESGYFDRDSYRSRRRSRSGSRERHHSRHRRWSPMQNTHHDSSRSERDYDRHSTRRSHRSRERSSRDDRGQLDDLMDADGFCPPTSAVLRSSDRRDKVRSSRDHSRSDRGEGSEKSSHRSHRHSHERSSRPSRSSRHRSRSRSHRREAESPAKTSAHSSEPAVSSHAGDSSKPGDPLMAAAAAAANIALALGASTKSTP